MRSATNREPGGPVEVLVERMATGGEAIAHLGDGRVLFVAGALPGETVLVQITEEKSRFLRGRTTQVIEASRDRVDPPCPHARDGSCGGCDWMYVSGVYQAEAKRRIVVEQLERLGAVGTPIVSSVPIARGRRTTVRCSVDGGRAGYRSRRSDRSFAATSCQAAHPLLEELIVHGRFGDATEVTLRVGCATGERMAITDGDPSSMVLPADVVAVARQRPGDAAIHEMVAGRLFRISAQSFFQTSSTGAEALVASVRAGLAGTDGDVVDLYSGVGLLGGAAAGDRLTRAVESNPSSVADARHNLAGRVRVDQARVEQWTPSPYTTVIADPARRGLAKEGVRVLDRTGASRLVLVSCDPASLGRDTALLAEQGWCYDRGEVIDMFPDTSRIEVVSVFSR